MYKKILQRILPLTIAAFGTMGHAQNYPQKPIRLILPVPPGGVADVIARPLAQKLTQDLGQPVVMDHRPGATGAIGLGLAAKAAPDGYTLLWGSTNTLCMGAALYAKSPPTDDYAAITPVIIFHNVLVMHNAVPAASMAELIALAKAKPEALRFASSGEGSTNHLTAALFEALTKTKLTHIPYKGGGPALIDVLGGHVDGMFATVPSAVTYIRDGRLKALVVTSEKRETALPSVPSAKEAGLPGLIVSTFNGVLAPAGTPRSIVNTLHAAIKKAAQAPDMVERYAAQAAEVYITTPEQFATMIRNDFVKWGKFVKDIGLADKR
ncbi:MAG: tripartite tricarboxylate transporter substrate binding protein [Proteobacteria bacterium]|nr:tripartite tricarboxylate transporter substrate binding protein [Pseudomonadota bacterium]